MHGAHLIGYGADAANTRNNIGYFVHVAALEKGFKKSWRFKNTKLHILNLSILNRHVERTFALHAGHHVDLDGSGVIGIC